MILPLQLWNCPKVYRPVTAIFFSPDSNENSEQSALTTSDLPQQKNVERFSESQRNQAGGYSFVFWLGAALADWLTLLAGWLTVWLADDRAETGLKCNNSHVCLKE